MWNVKPMGDGQLVGIQNNEVNQKLTSLEEHYPTKEEFMSLVYHSNVSPYLGISPSPTSTKGMYLSSAQNLKDYLPQYIIKKLGGPPRFIIEVGSFIGSGAINTWAPLVQMNNDTNAMLVCIDTWQGDVNMRLGKNFQEFMSINHGTPRLYHKFLSRVVEFGMTNYIYPLPMTSIIGARILALTHWKIDMIYLDSAHEVGETFAELVLYFQLVRKGGLLMGDDYSGFPAVKHDVDLFVKLYGDLLIFDLMDPSQWAIIKK